jgi:hypothetical protein
MEQQKTFNPSTVVGVWIIITTVGWLALGEGLKVGFGLVFGFVNYLTAVWSLDSVKNYHSLLFPKIFTPFTCWLFLLGNTVLPVLALFLIAVHVDWVSVALTVVGAIIVPFSALWYFAQSKLTPKPGIMMVEDDLYYLSGDILPPLFSRGIKTITPETKILVSTAYNITGIKLKLSCSFCFAPWVFTEEARQKLPGSMKYSTNLKDAEKELFSPNIKSLEDIWVFFYFSPIKKEDSSPYLWNPDTTLSAG